MAIMDDLAHIECRLSSLVDKVNSKGANKDLAQALFLIRQCFGQNPFKEESDSSEKVEL